MTAIEVRDLRAGYGKRCVVKGVTFTLKKGEISAFVGPNGAGKSTLLKAIFGLVSIFGGRIDFPGIPEPLKTPRSFLLSGFAYIPQGGQVFSDLTVRENLDISTLVIKPNQRRAGIDKVLAMFPTLEPRLRQRAHTLSGGERQMLALASALISSPHTLLLDEPSLGLAPMLVSEWFVRIRNLTQEHALTILIVEQKVRQVLAITDQAFVFRDGKILFQGSPSILSDSKLTELYS